MDRFSTLSDHGNDLIARGAFGEVSIGIDNGSNWNDSSSNNDTTSNNDNKNILINDRIDFSPLNTPLSSSSRSFKRRRYVAIKTIHKAIKSPNSNTSSFGMMSSSWGFAPSSPTPQKSAPPAKLLKEAFLEIFTLLNLSPHPHIAPLLSITASPSSPSSLSLIFPYSPIDLSTIISTHRQSDNSILTPPLIRTILYQILSALHHMHSHNLIHRDIKPSNITICPSSGVVQLIDFGLATPVGPHPVSSHGLTTLRYRSVEQLYGGEVCAGSCDVWSVGLVGVEMMSGGWVLFPGLGVLDQLGRVVEMFGVIEEGDVPEDWVDFDKIKFEVTKETDEGGGGLLLKEVLSLGGHKMTRKEKESSYCLLRDMLRLKPNERPAAAECMDNEYFWTGDMVDGVTMRRKLLKGLKLTEWSEEEVIVGDGRRQALRVAEERRRLMKGVSKERRRRKQGGFKTKPGFMDRLRTKYREDS